MLVNLSKFIAQKILEVFILQSKPCNRHFVVPIGEMIPLIGILSLPSGKWLLPSAFWVFHRVN